MNQKSKNNRFLPIWGVTLVSVLGSIAGLYFININIGINDFSNLVSLPLFSIIPGFLIILSVWAVAESKNIVQIPRNSLIFLTLAFSCWFAAEQIWNLYEHVLGIDPYPSIADFFYLAAPILMFVGLILYLKSTEKKISKKAIFVGIAASLIILIPSVLSIWEISFEDEPIEIIIALAYPVVDAALLVPLIIAMLFLITNRRDFFWMMILAGIATMIAADSIFLFLIIEDAYVDGHPVDILFVSSYTIWSFMMFYLVRQSKQETKSNLQEINARNTKAIEKYGVHLALIFINLTVVVFLIGTSFYMGPDSEDGILQFFFWFLIVLVIIFSSIVVILNSRLNKSLENRTKQLEDISKELIKNERFSAIGELASRISHDIRNPLSNIQMSIELMKNSPKDAKISDDEINVKLQLVSKNIERISHQVNDVLGYVKNQTMNKKWMKISESVQESIETVTVPSNIVIKIPKSNLMIYADPFQMQIVFNNIIINAIQSIGNNHGEITSKFSENENDVQIEIANTGPEIPENVLPHIFDSLVTTKQIGTGLGLSSCKTIIENHQGKIYAKNNPTTFVIKLPKTER